VCVSQRGGGTQIKSEKRWYLKGRLEREVSAGLVDDQIPGRFYSSRGGVFPSPKKLAKRMKISTVELTEEKH